MPIRSIMPLNERGIDRRARRRTIQPDPQQVECAKDDGPNDLNDMPLFSSLAYGGVANLSGDDFHRIGRTPRPGPPGYGCRHAVDLADRRFVRRMFIAGDQNIGAAPRPSVDLADQPFTGLLVAFAWFQGEQ